MLHMNFLTIKWCFCHDSWASRWRIFVRCTNSSSPVIFLKWRNYIGLSNFPKECKCNFKLMEIHQCNKVDFSVFSWCVSSLSPFIPIPLLSLRLESTLSGEKDLSSVPLEFRRHASLKVIPPEFPDSFVTLGFPISIFRLCAHLLHSCVLPRFVEQINIRNSNFFLSKFTLESVSYSLEFQE